MHVPGANEELAAKAMSGTEMLDHYPHSRFDGAVTLWYGKGPGLDRSGDALKHGNFAGTSRHGAVVVLSGEDHEARARPCRTRTTTPSSATACRSSTRPRPPSFSIWGLHAIALSRYSGCWVAMKLVGPLADGGATVQVSPDRPAIVIPELMLPLPPGEGRGEEAQVKEALCGVSVRGDLVEPRASPSTGSGRAEGWVLRPIRVVDRFDEQGRPLFPIEGGMDTDLVAERLGSRLLTYAGAHPGILGRLAELRTIRTRRYEDRYPLVVEIAQLPDGIRGYEQIKLGNVRVDEQRAAALLENLRESKVAHGARSPWGRPVHPAEGYVGRLRAGLHLVDG